MIAILREHFLQGQAPFPVVPFPAAEIYQREGVELDRSTLADWVGGTSRTLRPLVEALQKYVLGAEKLHGDDVPVPALDRTTARRRRGGVDLRSG
jgi:transposase